MSKIIGIDLGTTNSVVAVMEGGEPVVITNPEGSRITPSVVGFTKSGERLVGQVAKRQAVTNPENTVFSIKRFMGRKYDEVNEEMKMVPYKVVRAIERRRPHQRRRQGVLAARDLRDDPAEAEAGRGGLPRQTVSKAVITVPAYFNDAQRQATKDAGQIAGLEVMRIVNEPTAAALAYGLDKKKDETIAVYDFGGGTFDISILEVGEGVVEVKSTNGDTHLGGDNIDQRIIDWIIDEFKKDEGIDSRQGPDGAPAPEGSGGEGQDRALHRHGDRHQPAVHHGRRHRAEAPGEEADAREVRAARRRAAAADGRSDQAGARRRRRRSEARSTRSCSSAARRASRSCRQIVKELFGKEPHKGVNPDEVVAVGAAIQAGVLAGEVKDLLLLDVTPLSLGIETLGGVMTTLIPRNTTIPTRKSEMFSTAADNQTSVEVHVLQGERPMARDNRTLGKFHLVGLPPAPRGVPQIEVTFDIDANGIVNVSAKDMATQRSRRSRSPRRAASRRTRSRG